MCVVTSYYRLEEDYIVDINITVFNQLKKHHKRSVKLTPQYYTL